MLKKYALQRRNVKCRVVYRKCAIDEEKRALTEIPRIKQNLKLKKLLCLLAIVGIVSASNCSRIPENDDPIIGIWTKVEVNAENETIRQEWIFNDVYLGRYHLYSNNQLEVKTDFGWSAKEGLYTISYPGLEKLNDIVSMKTAQSVDVLEDIQGNVLAQRE